MDKNTPIVTDCIKDKCIISKRSKQIVQNNMIINRYTLHNTSLYYE